MPTADEKKIQELLMRGVDEIIDRGHLEKKLRSGKKLRVKLGIDPTSPNLHLGRTIPLLKLRDFQELGHRAIFIVGDATGIIGDSSDKDAERPMLTREQVKKNGKTYFEQAFKILDKRKTEIHYNSEWLNKMGWLEMAKMANLFGLREFAAREVIARRLKADKRVSYLEMMYPLFQGYDSVAVRADVELGGTDQRFNLLTGRKIQQFYGQESQDIIMNPLIEGTDGRKMSSSWGNVINVLDKPDDMFGKVMSVHDTLIERYLTLLTRLPMSDVTECMQLENPRDRKVLLAKEIVRLYHGDTQAERAAEHFETVFGRGELPPNMETFHAPRPEMPILDLLTETGLVSSKNEAKRLIMQGGIKINGQVQSDWQKVVAARKGTVIQAGKRKFIELA